MLATSPRHAVELMDRAFSQGDIETLLSIYEDAAIVVTEPNGASVEKPQLRSFFTSVMKSGLSASQLKTFVLEADGIALFLSRWTMSPKDAPPDPTVQTFVATTVFRKQPDGSWKALIDNAFGPMVLDCQP